MSHPRLHYALEDPRHYRISPNLKAFTAAWCLLVQPSFCIARCAWRITVFSAMPRMRPTSHAVLPSSVHRSVSS
jgi:hypothetical protein